MITSKYLSLTIAATSAPLATVGSERLPGTNMELNVCWLTDANALPNHCTPGTTCHPDATCGQVIPHVCACNRANSYRCECNQGFTGDGLTCKGSLPVSPVMGINYSKSSLTTITFSITF